MNKSLFEFLNNSPTAYHAVDTIKKYLDDAGFCELYEEEKWEIKPGGRYYVIRNSSSIVALKTGVALDDFSINITASHSDSPAFKIKEVSEDTVKGCMGVLNVEGYGGMLPYSWFDRPLSIAGRIVFEDENRLISRLVKINRDILLIPSLPIHMNREAGESFKYNKQVDLRPLFTETELSEGDLLEFIASETGIKAESILGSDLFLYNREKATNWGKDNEFISSPRLDDLQCAFATLKGFAEGENKENLNVYACLDNEEVGSGTKQGADSTFLTDVLYRICKLLGKSEEEYNRAVSSGLMLSCDNAHALHPAHVEKYDSKNCVYMNEGVVIKSHAGAKYTSDAVSIALVKKLCKRADVKVQYFANRSDMAGGSTLGNILTSHISINSVDIGLAQLAMHSSFESAGAKDTDYLYRLAKEFYSTHIKKDKGILEISEV